MANIFKKIFGSLASLARQPESRVNNAVAERPLRLGDYVKEYGVVDNVSIGMNDTEENPDSLDPSDYITMQQNDGEVQSIVNMISMPLQSTDYAFMPHPQDTDESICKYVETIFTGSVEEGGMSTPFELLRADMTRAVFEGYRYYEKVAQIIKEGPYEGLIGWKKIAPRDADTIEIRVDRYGGFMGAHQLATFGDRTVDVNIPPDKSMLFTFRKEKHPQYGESILRAANYHYKMKHKLYHIGHKTAEVEAMGIRVLKPDKQLDQDEKTAAFNALTSMGMNNAIHVPPGYDFDLMFGGKGYDVMPLIEHHNLMMVKSAMQSFMALGTSGGTGSYSLGQVQADWYSKFMQSILKQMETTINNYAIPQLVQWNFGVNYYPKIQFGAVDDTAGELLKTVFTEIMKQNVTMLPEGFVNEVIEKTAEELGLAYQMKETEKTSEEAQEMATKEKAKVNLGDDVEDRKFWRALTIPERRVDFSALESKLDNSEGKLAKGMEDTFQKEIPAITDEVEDISKSGKLEKIKKIELPNQDELREKILTNYSDIFQFGKLQAANEIKKDAPKTDTKMKKAMDKKVKEFMDAHQKEVTQHIYDGVKAMGETEVKLQETPTSIAQIVETALDYKVAETFSSLVINSGLNDGRDATFSEYSNDLDRYQYSAILDANTCNVCVSLDGRVVTSDDKSYYDYNPPRHFNCRCIWIGIPADMKGKPKVTGIPEGIPTGLNIAIAAPILSPSQKDAIKETERRADEYQDKADVYEKQDKYQNRQDSFSEKADKLKASTNRAKKSMEMDTQYLELDKEINQFFEG